MIPIPTAREWLTECKHELRPDQDMAEAVQLLASTRCAALPVVDEAGHLKGILTGKDCLRTFCHWVYSGVCGGRVQDYMSTVKATISPEMDLLSVASVFLQNYFPSLPVLEKDRLVGMIPRLAVLRGIAEWQRKRQADVDATAHAMERPASIQDMQKAFGSLTREQAVERFGHANER